MLKRFVRSKSKRKEKKKQTSIINGKIICAVYAERPTFIAIGLYCFPDLFVNFVLKNFRESIFV